MHCWNTSLFYISRAISDCFSFKLAIERVDLLASQLLTPSSDSYAFGLLYHKKYPFGSVVMGNGKLNNNRFEFLIEL